jgi:uncharacterized membrane protein
MNRCKQRRILLVSLLVVLLLTAALGAEADAPVVRGVLFYSPSCGHCHKVITEDLPPLFDKYGDQLQIIGISTADASGRALYDAAADRFNIPPESRGVPLLVVADVWLMGSVDIPDRLPGLIEQHLAAGGVDWPDIPGLAEAIAQAETAQPAGTPPPATPAAPATGLAPASSPSAAPTATPPPGLVVAGGNSGGLRARFDRDPAGNALALVVLAGMVAAFGWILAQRPWRAWGTRTPPPRSWYDWAVPLLSVMGLAVAGYLAYVETQQVQAVCGPVGDCNSVQQSEYALLFGLVPIGVVGVLGYLAILATWTIHRLSSGRIGRWAGWAAWAMAAGGVLFSIYLTFLEPFVIGATCAWCLSSAVIMTSLLLLLTARFPARGPVYRAAPEHDENEVFI